MTRARGRRAGRSEDRRYVRRTLAALGLTRWRPGTKGERTQRGMVLGAIGGHGFSRKKDPIWDFGGSLAEARRTSERKQSTKAVITMSIKFLGEKRERG
jgi:hypothetical protein